MQISLIAIGKTQASWIRTGTDEYIKRLNRYARFSFIELPDIKARSGKPDPTWVKSEEGKVLSKHLDQAGVDHLVLLDERGKSYSSLSFAKHLESLQIRGLKHLAFVIGGPYGFDETIRSRAHGYWSLGPLTFSHQMIRPFAAEQLYRAHTILKNEPYHHE